MADLHDGWTMLKRLADLDWYAANARQLAEDLNWEYQKTLRVLKDLEADGLAWQQPNAAWRISGGCLELLVRVQASMIERLNQVTVAATRKNESCACAPGRAPAVAPELCTTPTPEHSSINMSAGARRDAQEPPSGAVPLSLVPLGPPEASHE